MKLFTYAYPKYKFVKGAQYDQELYFLDLYNPRKIHYLLTSNVFVDFCNNKLNLTNQFLIDAELSNEILSELKVFYSKFLMNKVIQASVFIDLHKFTTNVISFNHDFYYFVNEILQFYENIVVKDGRFSFDTLSKKNVNILLTKLLPYSVSGSIFQYFDSMNEFDIEIRSSFGVIHDSTSVADIHIIDPISLQVKRSEVVRQRQMKVINNNTIIDLDVPYVWQKEQKLDQKTLDKIVNIYLQIKQILKKPVEIYFGILDGHVYITNINFDYDSVIDYVELKNIGSLDDQNDNLIEKVRNNVKIQVAKDFYEFLQREEQSSRLYSQLSIDNNVTSRQITSKKTKTKKSYIQQQKSTKKKQNSTKNIVDSNGDNNHEIKMSAKSLISQRLKSLSIKNNKY
ncbi:MAG: hypothetical protein NZZ41_05745 [Candidatus Dojkabacteria bacterium]|nr:hypothetical protein [Candidatus Dojkabacteria bacterium]